MGVFNINLSAQTIMTKKYYFLSLHLLRLAFIFFTGVCFTNVCQAQILKDYSFKSYTAKDGLIHSYVTDIAQDSLGFIWFATENGLHKFDGVNLQVFNYESNRSNSILSNEVREIFVDSFQNIWALYSSPSVWGFPPKHLFGIYRRIWKWNMGCHRQGVIL